MSVSGKCARARDGHGVRVEIQEMETQIEPTKLQFPLDTGAKCVLSLEVGYGVGACSCGCRVQ